MAREMGEQVLVEGSGRAELRRPSYRRMFPTASVSVSFFELQLPGTSTASFQH